MKIKIDGGSQVRGKKDIRKASVCQFEADALGVELAAMFVLRGLLDLIVNDIGNSCQGINVARNGRACGDQSHNPDAIALSRNPQDLIDAVPITIVIRHEMAFGLDGRSTSSRLTGCIGPAPCQLIAGGSMGAVRLAQDGAAPPNMLLPALQLPPRIHQA